jgi:outer membrane protein OmpA-like peptidoglycan-associated protein
MKLKMRYLAPLSLVALLSGCIGNHIDGVTWHTDTFTLGDGTQGYRVLCHGLLETSAACQRHAEHVCGSAGYHVVSAAGFPADDPRQLVFACGPEQAAQPEQPAPAAATVAAPAPQQFTLNANVLFAFNRASLKDIREEGRHELGQIAHDVHSQYRTIQSVVVKGYTDRIGGDAYNLKLSQARAEAVRSYLVAQGLDANVVTAQGLGKADPVTHDCPAGKSSKAIACLAPDRRVVIEVSGEKQ